MERAGVDQASSGFHLYDERGRALVLRTDLSTAVARLAADRLSERPLPLRLAYEGPVYRTEATHNRREGEFSQLGAELLGLGAAAADAEVVVLLCDALSATGLRGFRLAIGSVAFHRELVAALGLTPDDGDDVFDALADRDYALLETIVSRRGVSDEGRKTLQRALDLSPGKGALTAARKLSSSEGMEDVVDRLVRVQELADDAGYGDLVGFDFGLCPSSATTRASSSRRGPRASTFRSPWAAATTVCWPPSTGPSRPPASRSTSTGCTRPWSTRGPASRRCSRRRCRTWVGSTTPSASTTCAATASPSPPCPATPRRASRGCTRIAASSSSRCPTARHGARGATCCAPSEPGEPVKR